MAFGLLSRLFGRRKLPSELRYEDARQVLESHQLAAKRELAGRSDAPPEALYYLACDDDAGVLARAIVRLAISYVSMPPEADHDVAADLARLMTPFADRYGSGEAP